MFSESRFRIGGIALLMFAMACAAAPARAALPSGWEPGAVAPDPPSAGAHFGASLVSVDLNGDGTNELVVGSPDFNDGSAGTTTSVTGRVYALRANGSPFWPDAVSEPPQAANVASSKATRFGAQVAVLGDIGQCIPLGETTCAVGEPDGSPELLASAPGTDTGGGTDGADEGAVYVLDGTTGRILKTIQLAERSPVGGAEFGKSLASLSGEPPCDGFAGIGACPYPTNSATAIGDVDGGGEPDFVVGAPSFAEDSNTAEGRCSGTCLNVGRAYIFRGEAITGSSNAPLTEADDPETRKLSFPGDMDVDDPRYGSVVGAAGDVGTCQPVPPAFDCLSPNPGPNNAPDGFPDVVITAPGANTSVTDAGAAYVVDARANGAMTRLEDPQPVEGGAFGSFGSMSPAVGDLAGSPVGDSVIGASSGAGTAIAFNGDPASPSALASLFAPAPASGDEFGSSIAGFGNIAGDAPGEIAIGAPGRRSVYVISVCAQQFLREISDPVDQGGSRFGATVAPVGDSNGDGFIDFAVGAPGYDHDSATAADSGRVYLFLSTGPASAFAGCGGPVDPGEPGAGGGGARNPGGAPKASPPKVNSRVLRSLVLRPNRRRLSRGAALRFKGSLKAKAGRLSCQRRQKIALQRRKLRGGRYQTFDVAVTTKSGAFKVRTRPSRSFLYRARVSQTSVCMGATSKAAKVVVRRR